MSKNRRRLTTLAIVFALVFVVGVVYAATNGTLTFTGSATLGAPEVLLEIVVASEDPVVVGECSGTMVVAADGQSATISATLPTAGEVLSFPFTLSNEGTAAAKVGTPQLVFGEENADEALVVAGDYADLADVVVAIGASSTEYSISVEWDSDAEFDESAGEYSFVITIDYAQDDAV